MKDRNNQEEIFVDCDKNGIIYHNWQADKIKTLELAQSYARLEDDDKACKCVECGTYLDFYYDLETGGHKLRHANFCKLRLCPMCIKRRQKKIYHQMSKIMNVLSDDYAFLFLTLTQKNVSGEELSDEIDRLMKGWEKLSRRTVVRKAVKGWFRALEVTHNLDVNSVSYDTYHPHFHVVLVVGKKYFKGKNYIKHEDWCKMWQECMGIDYLPNVDVRRFKASNKKELQKSVSEAAKYTVKDNDFLIPDNEELQDKTVAILTHALTSRRLIAFGGVFKEVHKQLKLDDIDKGDLVNVEGEELRDDVDYYRKVVMWNFGYSNYYINSIILPEDVKRQDLAEQMSRAKPKTKKSYEDLENFKKNMSNKKLTYSVEDIQKKIDDIDRKVGNGGVEEQK
ncbi:MAG: protein rep [Lactobacillus sp.]|nr:protein rep [Lactobacillus sp.]